MSNYIIQSVLIPTDLFTAEEAINYIKDNYKFKKIDYTPKFYRFRQFLPRYLKEKKGLDKIKTVIEKKTGIHKIIYYKE